MPDDLNVRKLAAMGIDLGGFLEILETWAALGNQRIALILLGLLLELEAMPTVEAA